MSLRWEAEGSLVVAVADADRRQRRTAGSAVVVIPVAMILNDRDRRPEVPQCRGSFPLLDSPSFSAQTLFWSNGSR